MRKFSKLDKCYAYALVNFDRDTVDDPTANQGDYREIKALFDKITGKARELGYAHKHDYPDFDKVKPKDFRYLTLCLSDEEYVSPIDLEAIELYLEHYPLNLDADTLRYCKKEDILDCFDVKRETAEDFYEQHNNLEIWYNDDSVTRENFFDELEENSGLSADFLYDGIKETILYEKMIRTDFYSVMCALENNDIAYIEVGDNKVYLPFIYPTSRNLPNKELIDEQDMLDFLNARKEKISNEKITYAYDSVHHEAVGFYEPPSEIVLEKTKRVADLVSPRDLISDYFTDLINICGAYSIYKTSNDRNGQPFEEQDIFVVEEEQVEIV